MSAWDVQLFFDGECPLCKKDVAFMQWLDRKHQRVSWVDIAARDFSAESHGLTMNELMESLHARLPDGSWVKGAESFRRIYEALGFGWLVAITRWPLVRQVVEWAYDTFAKNRLRLTGRCAPDGACALPEKP
jgi:predicted DCC family thiol-disulfide oxidoreductase YuxK